MTDRCPDCGAEAGFAEQNARVLHGTCAGCGRTFTIVRELSGPTDAGPAPAEPAPEGERPTGEGPSASGPSCGVCGATLVVRPTSDTSLEARCRSCGTTFTYVLSTAPFPRGREASRARAGPPFTGPARSASPRGRPCRECGGPLSFSTDDDGNVVGECASCGNRFTLPPRREFGGGRGARGNRPGPGRSFDATYRRPGSWPRQAEGDRPRRFDERPPRFRRRERRSGSDDEDERRRRRPRRE